MKPSRQQIFILGIAIFLLIQLFIPNIAYLHNNANNNFNIGLTSIIRPFIQQSSTIKIIGPNGDTVPVVNEQSQITLTVMDGNGRPITSGLTFETDSPQVLSVSSNGMVTGNQQGFATVTAKMGSMTASAFVAVSKVTKGKAKKVPGDTKVDANGAIYISDPVTHTIFKKNTNSSDANLFAGRSGMQGRDDGEVLKSTFGGPIGIAIDNRPQGGIYVADVLNNSIRKINFDNTVITLLGNGSQGTMGDITAFTQAVFKNPQGIAVDSGGNLFIADTGNHAIYLADFSRQEVRLIAGSPGNAGKADGKGRTAMFNRPASISVRASSSTFFATANQEVVLVADTGNGKVRSISSDGEVKTIGPINSTIANDGILPLADSEFTFNEPSAIEIDDVGTIYVVEKSGVRLITQSANGSRQVMSLAQNSSINQASSVVVQGTQAVVLDKSAASDDDAVKIVTIGAPTITSMSRGTDKLEGGSEVVISGRNFAPESLVVLGDTVINNAIVESATRIRIPNIPKQNAPGDRTLSIRTRGGVVQTKFSIFSKPFSELNNGEITTIAGGVPFLGDSGLAINSTFNGPQDVAVNSDGEIIISDSGSGRIRRIDNSGIITTIAGNGAISSKGDNGPAISASINVPSGIAVDGSGNIIIADSRGHRVRRVNAQTGIITSIAGTGENDFGGDGGQATLARLSFPTGVAVDTVGNLYIADSGNSRIRKVDLKTGIISTVAGNGKIGFAGDGGMAIDATLRLPEQVNVDKAGNIYIVDNFLSNTASERIRKVDIKTGIINTIAGNGAFRFNGDDIPALSAGIDPFDVEIDAAGNVFFADLTNNRIRRVDAKTGIITTVAGDGVNTFKGDGGLATQASLSNPNGLAIDGLNNLIIADQQNNRIRKVDANTKIITTIAGTELPVGDNDLAVKANIADPITLLVEPSNNILIGDTGNKRIRRLDINSGMINTIAGNGKIEFSDSGLPALQTSIIPFSIVQDPNGNIFVADFVFNVIRRVDTAGRTTIVAGILGKPGFGGDNGAATNANLSSPISVALDSAGNLFIAELDNSRVRRVDARTGIITTVAGNGIIDVTGDGGQATSASLFLPSAITIDRNNNLLILDLAGNIIRRVDARTGIITRIAGNGDVGFSGDGGSALQAAFNFAFGLTTDNAGNIFVADTVNNRIRRIDTNGIISTVVGNGDGDYTGDGTSAIRASLNRPKGVALDSAGNLYIAGGFNNAIRIVKGMGAGGPRGDFNLSINPTTQNINAGQSTTFTVGTQAISGFAQPINLSVTVNPPNSGITASFSNSTISAGSNSALTINVAGNVPTTNFTLNITGSSGQFIRSQTVNLNVTGVVQRDFNLTVNPASQNVMAGATTSFTVGVEAINGFSQPVSLAAMVNPANNFSTSFTQTNVNPGNNTSLTVSVPANTPNSSTTITITGTSGQLVRSQMVTIIVGTVGGTPTISRINDQTVKPGDMLVVPISATDPDGNNGLKLSLTTAPNYVTLSDDGGGKGRITIAPSATENQSGRVVVRVLDSSGLFSEASFNITLANLTITNAQFVKPNLTISGNGFGTSGAMVQVNNVNISQAIASQTNTVITLKGNKKKLNLKKGQNTVTVTINGATASFNFNF